MKKTTFTIEINAPEHRVWQIMLGKDSYRQWTEVFQKGSHYKGSWGKGSKILFLAPDKNGKDSGMVSKIVEHIPHEYISIEHLGEVIDGIEDTTSERVQKWKGARENYTFSKVNSGTHLAVDLEMNSDEESKKMLEMFEDMWPKALKKLKEICERP